MRKIKNYIIHLFKEERDETVLLKKVSDVLQDFGLGYEVEGNINQRIHSYSSTLKDNKTSEGFEKIFNVISEELWEQVRKGNESAYGILYELYFDDLYNYGLKITSDKTKTLDCIQDLFVDIYKYRKNLANQPNVKAYLIASFKRKLYKKYPKKELTTSFEEGNNMIPQLYVSSSEDDIVNDELNVEKTQILQKALLKLSPKQMKAVKLKFFQNKSYQEISEIMGVSIETSRTLIYRAMSSLRGDLTVSLM